jgi:hypothetical protein
MSNWLGMSVSGDIYTSIATTQGPLTVLLKYVHAFFWGSGSFPAHGKLCQSRGVWSPGRTQCTGLLLDAAYTVPVGL